MSAYESLSAIERLHATTLTTAQVRRVDQLAVERFGMNSLVLMENAALGCVNWLVKKFSSASSAPRTVILCGRGNNGGDGWAIARHLRVLGWPCQVLGVGPASQQSADAHANFRILGGSHSEYVHLVDLANSDSTEESNEILLREADLVVDAMLGTGASGPLRAPFSPWCQSANQADGLRIAVDIPTGVNAETAQADPGRFRADMTLTFVAKKPAMSSSYARELFGEIEVLPIGIPLELIQEVLEWNQ